MESLRRVLSREREQRQEALEQQTAISDILRAISSSPTDVRPVFDTILSNATRLCAGDVGVLWRYDGSHLRAIAHHNASAAGFAYLEQHPLVPGAYNPTPRAALEQCVVHEVDVFANPEYRPLIPRGQAKGSKRSATQIAVPLLRQGTLLGVITVWRLEKRPFTDQQIALLKTFADQAAIALENARLFNETKEALERQTATAEILKVISSSPTDVQPVFDAIVKTGVRLFHGMSVSLRLVKGDQNVRVAFAVGAGSKVTGDTLSEPTLLNDRSISGRAILCSELVHSADVMAEEWLGEQSRIVARRMGYRSVAAAPMLREGKALGVIGVTRADPGTFSDKELALLRTFADQAVIAIENVRLFNETKEALERQTATAEILKVIASSPNDIQPVLDAVAERATRLCDAMHSTVFLVEGDVLQQRAYCGERKFPADNVPISQKLPISRSFVTGRALIERRAVHVEDIVPVLDTEYPGAIANQRRLGFRTILAVPMLLKGDAIGAIGVWRREVRPFTEQEIGLLQTFADQAVIAIENVRLFNETKEALDHQTSTAEVLKTISRSTFDLQAVLQTLLDNATRLSGAERAVMLRPDAEGNYLPALTFNLDPALLARLRERPIRPGRDSINGRVLLEKKPIHVPDVLADPEYRRHDLVDVGRYRTVLSVPMLRDGEAIGLISLNKGPQVDPFTERQMELVTTFADQAVIAIENVRLFKEIEKKSAQLEVANKHKSDFLANMSHELRTPLNAIIGFSEALIDKLFGDLTDKQLEYQKDIHQSGKHLLSLINDILDLSKIEAGRMELELSTFHLPTAVSNAVTLIRERALRHGIALGVEVDERLGEFEADERKVKQILLNLLSNAVKFTPDGGRVDVSAKLDTDKVEIAVKDTGVGIAPADQASLFEEFKQFGKDSSRKAEGTGLGLALTKRLVELHGGQISVDSAVGRGSVFHVTLPVRS
ncbi:MAG TPA: GAF domain-containing protein [Burkholderiales bacterium]